MPAHFLLFTLLTTSLGDASSFAKSLALVGDLDGDRCCEIAVGSPSDGDGRRGKVFLFAGKSGNLLRELTGPSPDSGFGTDVSPAGDQDGDGIPDLAVGAPLVRGDGREGRVEIVSGKDGRSIRALLPEAGEKYFGTDLTSIGDVDGDGKEDLLVRARAGAGPAEHERFAAISGASGRRLFAVDSPDGVTSHDLGRPLARLPDVDGDGIPDFAVEYGCEVHVVSGKTGKLLKTLSSSLPADAKSTFGFAIVGLPGKPPLVAVGDTRADQFGAVSVLHLLVGEDTKEGGGAQLKGDEGIPGLGCSLAFAGDLDGDKVPDIAATCCDGRKGGVLLLSSKDLSAFRTIGEGPSTEGRLPLGWRVAAGQDIDGDGTPDLAVARYWPTAAASAARGVVIFSGRDSRQIRELTTPPAQKSQK